MSYEEAFAAVPGVEVEWCEYLGSYQGRLVCKITHEGQEKYILDYYGSCSGCDSFEAEFGWKDDQQPDYQERLADFGQSYVDAALTLDEALAEMMPKPGAWYDTDLKEGLDRILVDHPEKKALMGMFPKGSA